MNGTSKGLFYILLCGLLVSFVSSCRTVPSIDTSKTDLIGVDVMQTQTEIATSGKDLATTIDDIKAITDDAKVSGEISKEKVIKVVEYVDKSAGQVKALNETIAKQTGQISTLEKSRITDNSVASKAIADKQGEIDREKTKASICFRWALIVTVISLVLAGILWLPKLLKLIA